MVWNRQILVAGVLCWCLTSATSEAQQYRAAQASFEEPRKLTYFESCGSRLDPAAPNGSGAVELCNAVCSVSCEDSGCCDLSVVPEYDAGYDGDGGGDCEPACLPTGGCCSSNCDALCGGILANSEFFFAGDGWKTKGDDDDSNNFGLRFGFNTSVGLGCLPARIQIGSSFGGYDFLGREDGRERDGERQIFVTTGIYRRSDVRRGNRVSAGVVWDYMHDNAWGEESSYVDLHQFRSQLGYAFNECTEIGAWGAFRMGDDTFNSSFIGPNAIVRAMSQASIYLKRNWEFGGDTTLYVGLAEEPSEVVLGFNGRIPLSHRAAAFGGVHYGIPSTTAGDTAPNGFSNSYSEENWLITFGFVFYPGARARSDTVSGPCNLPLMPVADNGTFMVRAPTGSL